MSLKTTLVSTSVIILLLFGGFSYICSRFKPNNKHLGIFSAETFINIQDYVDRDPNLDALQRLVRWKPPRGVNYYYNSLDRFDADMDDLPESYAQIKSFSDIIEPKGFEGRLECRMKMKLYLKHTTDLFCGGLGEDEETSKHRKKFYGSSDKLKSLFQDKSLESRYANDDVYLQFSLSVPLSVTWGEYTVALLNSNYDPSSFSESTPALISYKLSRKNKVDTYTIRVRRGPLVFETSLNRAENLQGISSLYRLALMKNDEVEVWAIDLYKSIMKANFFDVFKPVGPSDPEYVEPTETRLREARRASLSAPGGIGFYGQGYEIENDQNRATFSYLHLSSSIIDQELVQKDFSINKNRRLMAAMEVGNSIISNKSKNPKEEESKEHAKKNVEELKEDL